MRVAALAFARVAPPPQGGRGEPLSVNRLGLCPLRILRVLPAKNFSSAASVEARP